MKYTRPVLQCYITKFSRSSHSKRFLHFTKKTMNFYQNAKTFLHSLCDEHRYSPLRLMRALVRRFALDECIPCV